MSKSQPVTNSESEQNRRPLITIPTNNPDDPGYLVATGTGFDGVVEFDSNGGTQCTGALLKTGRHILTAAHCFDINDAQGNDLPNLNPNPADYTIYFDLPSGRVVAKAKKIFVNPNWKANFNSGDDVAIIELEETAPKGAERYPIYTENNQIGQVITRVGYGVKGTGIGGEVPIELDPIPTKRKGQNRYDAGAEILNQLPNRENITPNTQLAYDFDSGLPANDAFGIEHGIRDLGLGIQEVGSSLGDSGGPSFINGKIAGIVSSGLQPITPGIDVTDKNDTSFGEYSIDTKVATYAGFILQTIVASSQGNDIFTGTDQNDTMNGFLGIDLLEGFAGDDILFGGKDSDQINGGFGNDLISGNIGDDQIKGDGGNDTLFGGQNVDSLNGGDGDDYLSGDLDQDFLTGGSGSDTFVLSNRSVTNDPNLADEITDFQAGIDRIALSTGLTESNLSLQSTTINQVPGVLIIDRTSNNHLAFVANITALSLQNSFVPVNFGNIGNISFV